MGGPAASSRYVAFLKGINVGGHTVKMDRLRRLFEEMGHQSVSTYIASGNVVFDSTAEEPQRLEAGIAAGLETALGYPVPVFLRRSSELSRIAANRPFSRVDSPDAGHSVYVVFLPKAPESVVVNRVLAANTDTDRFHVEGREIYWLCRTRFTESPFSGGALEKLAGMQVTVRNSTTVSKITARYCTLTR